MTGGPLDEFMRRYQRVGGSEQDPTKAVRELFDAYESAQQSARELGARFEAEIEQSASLARQLNQLRAIHFETLSSERRFRALVAHSPDATVLVDREGRVTYASASASAVWGAEPDDLVSRSLAALVHPEDISALEEALRGVAAEPRGRTFLDVRRLGPDEHVAFIELACVNLLDEPAVEAIVVSGRDVTERRLLEERLDHLAYYDPLTDLPNRVAFMRQLEEAVRNARHTRQPLALLVCDVDRFKLINDAQGHTTGDRTLVAVAARLRERAGERGAFIARLGGDEFAIILENANSLGALAIANEIAGSAAETDEARIIGAGPSLCIGIASTEEVAGSATELLQAADLALYEAKRSGRRRIVTFGDETRGEFEDRFRLETDLQEAVAGGQLFVEYQPVVRLPGRRLHAMEALVRWRHPERGVISPARFIPMAEESGEIVAIGEYVLGEAIRQMKEWDLAAHAAGMTPPACVSVNASAVELREPSYVERLRVLLARHGFSPERLQIEITESVLVEDAQFMLDRMEELKGLGVRLAIDDFGTGYSSLSYLASMPIDVVKIDRSFVGGMQASERVFAIMRATFMLARALNLSVVAEGVESQQQEWLLSALGGDLAQGYYYSRPLSAQDATRLIEGDTGAAQPERAAA